MSHTHDHGRLARHKYPTPPSLAELGLEEPAMGRRSGDQLPKLKRFRFQLFHRWLTAKFEPCRVADIGGGKGLLTYLLRQSGWEGTVIDPHSQDLPSKYKDLDSGQRVRIAAGESVPRLDRPFEPAMAADFDLLVGMHAHGCNLLIIESAKVCNKGFVLMPCCVIDEPATPPPDVHWLPWLAGQAEQAGFRIEYFKLNFKGQAIGIHGVCP